MGEDIGRDKMEGRLADTLASRFKAEVAALEVDGVVDGEAIIAWARANPRSAIFAMLKWNDAKAVHALSRRADRQAADRLAGAPILGSHIIAGARVCR
jgi:hypothetical protein